MKTSKITATEITSPQERLRALHRLFGPLATRVEQAIFDDLAKKAPTSYKGGFWNFYHLSNGGFYMAPAGEEPLHLIIPSNLYEGDVSPDAAGIITCLYVFNSLCWAYPGREDFHDLFHNLRAFAGEHPEAVEIYRAID